MNSSSLSSQCNYSLGFFFIEERVSLAQDTNDKHSNIENHYHIWENGRGNGRGPYKFSTA